MLLAKLKTVGTAALAAAVLIAGAFGLSAQDSAQRPGLVQGAPAVSAPAARGRPNAVRDADRIVRLAIEAERQQDAGDVAAAIKTLAKIEEAIRAWKERLSPPPEVGEQKPAAGDLDDLFKKILSTRLADPNFREAHLHDLIKQIGDCQSCHTAPNRDPVKAHAETLLEQIRVKDQELAALRKQLEASRGGQNRGAMPESFRGTIKAVERDLATITPGADAGVAVGSTLQVYRLNPRPEYLGTLIIRAVTPHEAVGQLEGLKKSQVKVGDQVAAKLQ